MMEIYSHHNYSLLKASMVVALFEEKRLVFDAFSSLYVIAYWNISGFLGLQLDYTAVFGSYSSFLFVRTGNLVAPLIAHAFCNYMGLPLLLIPRKGLVSVAFVAGMLSFAWLLLPLTRPDL
ncbi:hypothetical protein Goshw_026056 [Gossypium schwendimanii]|uniref:intramembrane prenyl-peptidase Rce1 n=1 Tax=Gossypium schwendimanii TaxID=34291 RepID=A0A7J9LIC5_GOSSC|nr:hypothetical protein [Gossypium schwendimanii]